MATDRFLTWPEGERVNRSEVEELAKQYFDFCSFESYAHLPDRLFINLPGTANFFDKPAGYADHVDRRWIEVIFQPGEEVVDVLTRHADRLTMDLAQTFADFLQRRYNARFFP